MKSSGLETKVGIFALIALGLIAIATIKVGGGDLSWGGGFQLQVTLDSAVGVSPKTPVEIAGIEVGQVEAVELAPDGRRAIAFLKITRKNVHLEAGTKAVIRAKGFLGDTYIELIPGSSDTVLGSGDEIVYGGMGGDINMMITEFSEIAKDVREITRSARDLIGDDNAPVNQTVDNMRALTATIRKLVEQNEKNVNTIAENFAELSDTLRYVMAPDAEQAMSRVANITRKIDEGHGTVGQLINSNETGEKINQALDTFNDTLGGFQTLQTEIGYHSEYLSQTKDFKHYVHLNLRPRPDEAFMFEFVEDRAPSPSITNTTSTVTAGGSTSTVTTETATINQNDFRISAQLAKTFHDLTLRGGIIENRGGIGADYTLGPLDLHASAWDFSTVSGNKPHLKFWGQLNVTPSIYVLGGMDDPLNPNQSTDWFLGAGVSLIDEDLKGILSGVGLSTALNK